MRQKCEAARKKEEAGGSLRLLSAVIALVGIQTEKPREKTRILGPKQIIELAQVVVKHWTAELNITGAVVTKFVEFMIY